jgi:hypothetical protein
MVRPIDYTMDVLNPIEGMLRGYSLGRQDIEQRQVMQEREQVMGIRGQQEARAQQQEARAQQQFEAQQAAAARKRAQAAAMQDQLMGLRSMALEGKLTSEALDQFALANASTFDEFRSAFQNLSEPRRQETTQFNLQLNSSLLRGNTDVAMSMLDTRIAAAENAGTPEAMREAAALKAVRSEIELDPVGFAGANLANMAAQGAIDSTTAKTFLDSVGQGEAVSPIGKLRADLDAGRITQEEFDAATAEKGPLVQNIIGDSESTLAKELAKGQATSINETIDIGSSASRNIVEIDNLENILSDVATGTGASVKAYLGRYGIATEGLDLIQAAEAAINRLVPAQRPPGSGTMSDADLELFKRSLPSLINQTGGNQKIIDTIRAINEYDVARAIIAGKVSDWVLTPKEERKELEAQGVIINPSDGRKAMMEIPNPLEGFKAPQGGTAPAGGAPAPAGDQKAAFMADPRVQALPEAQREVAWEIYQQQVSE